MMVRRLLLAVLLFALLPRGAYAHHAPRHPHPLEAANAMRPCLWPEPYLAITDAGQDTIVYLGRTMMFFLGYRWPNSADDFPRHLGTPDPPLVLSFYGSPMSFSVVPFVEPFEARNAVVNCFLNAVP